MTYKQVQWPKYVPVKSNQELRRLQKTQLSQGKYYLQSGQEYDIKGNHYIALFGLVWSLAGIVPLLFSLRGGAGLFLLVPVLWTVPGLVILGFGVKVMRWGQHEKKFAPARLLMPEEKLYLGETPRLSFQRELRDGMVLPQSGQLHARLLRVEVTRTLSGTDIVYEHEFLSEKPLATRAVSVGQSQLVATWDIELPADAQPNFFSDGHWILWQLQVLQVFPNQKPLLSEFILPVMSRSAATVAAPSSSLQTQQERGPELRAQVQYPQVQYPQQTLPDDGGVEWAFSSSSALYAASEPRSPQRRGSQWVFESFQGDDLLQKFYLSDLIMKTVFGGVLGWSGLVSLVTGVLALLSGLVLGALFAVLGLAFLAAAFHMLKTSIQTMKRRRWAKRYTPALLLSPDKDLSVGNISRLTFERGLRDGKTLPQNEQLYARLLQVEVTRQQVGGSPDYDQRFLREEPLPMQEVTAGQANLSVTWCVALPADAQPNHFSGGRRVFWQLQVLQVGAGHDPLLSEFVLPVN